MHGVRGFVNHLNGLASWLSGHTARFFLAGFLLCRSVEREIKNL